LCQSFMVNTKTLLEIFHSCFLLCYFQFSNCPAIWH